MDQHIETDVLLPLDSFCDELIDLGLVSRLVELAALVATAEPSHRRRLRQAPCCGGRQPGKTQVRLGLSAETSMGSVLLLPRGRELGYGDRRERRLLAPPEGIDPIPQRGRFLPRELKASRQLLTVDRVRQKHQRGRRCEVDGLTFQGRVGQDLLGYRIGIVGPHRSPVQDGHQRSLPVPDRTLVGVQMVDGNLYRQSMVGQPPGDLWSGPAELNRDQSLEIERHVSVDREEESRIEIPRQSETGLVELHFEA